MKERPRSRPNLVVFACSLALVITSGWAFASGASGASASQLSALVEIASADNPSNSTGFISTPAATAPVITSIPSVVLVGASFVIKGSSFTPGSVVNFFVATSHGPVNLGPFKVAAQTSSQLTINVPPTTTLGQGFVAVQVVNTDTGFLASNLAYALLQGSAAKGIPTIRTIDGVGLAATSMDPNYATNNVETVVPQGSAVKLGGTGFDTGKGVAIDLFCACPGGKVGPFFLNPGNPGLSSTLLTFTLPAAGQPNSPPTGPGSFVVSNSGAAGTYTTKSNAVSVPIGKRISVDSVSVTGHTIVVNGSGFSLLTVINFFNKQSSGAVNLGGLKPDGSPRIPLTIVNQSKFTLTVPGGAIPGPSYIQALNPPFVPFTSSGTSPGGAFNLGGATPTPRPTPTGNPTVKPTPTRTPVPTVKHTPTISPRPTHTPTPSPTPTPTPGPLFVSDQENNRVLEYKRPLSNGMNASVLIGQPIFTASFPAITQSGLNFSWFLAQDAAGKLYVADGGANRVLQFVPPFSNRQKASLVIGQPDFVSSEPATTQSQMSFPTGVAVDKAGNLFVAERTNNRILEFVPPFSNGMAASMVIGQPGFTSNVPATTQSGLRFPAGVALDHAGNLFVADQSNNRVLEFEAPFLAGMKASVVIGQPNFTSRTPGVTQSGLSGPLAVGLDKAGNLFVADATNNRVLEFRPPFSSGMKAAVVIGQSSFTSNGSGTSASELVLPVGIGLDSSDNLYVSDNVNNRILEFEPPFFNGMGATLVIGQPDFTSAKANTTANGLAGPVGLVVKQP